MPDLFELALANRVTLQQRFDALCLQKADAAPQLSRFAYRVQETGRVSFNMRQMSLISFLSLGEHQNTYEWARARAAHSTRPLDEILRARLGPLFEARMAFDHFFAEGESFRYGALNIGGAGATTYGEFCAVLPDAFFRNRRETAYLAWDSLRTYVLPNLKIDEPRLGHEVASHQSRHHLAVLKLHSDVCGAPESSWPPLVCSEAQYIEAIFIGQLKPSDLESVRMLKADHDLYFDFAFDAIRRGLSPSDKMLVDGFMLVLELLEAHGVPLEVV